MNVKVIIGGIVAVAVVYYGASWLKLRSDLTEQLQADPYVQQTAGHFLDFSMEKSKDAPMCGDYCGGTARYHFMMKGDKSTLFLSADYNKATRQFTHRVFCDESGKSILMDKGMTVLACR